MARHRPRHAAPSEPRARRSGVGLVVGSVLLAAGATLLGYALFTAGDDPAAVATEPTGAPVTADAPATTAATTTTTTRDPVLGSGESVTLAFGGDTNFEGSAGRRLDDDPASVLATVAGVLGGADLAVVNMETAIGVGGTPADKEFTFQAPPSALDAFRAAGVDVVSAANNHGMDFGLESLRETLAAEQASGLPVIGIGNDEAEAYAPFVAEVRGQRIAVIAATQVLDDHLIDEWTATPTQPGLASAKRVDRLLQAVTEARAAADTVVVFLHWGVERDTCPTANQQDLAANLVAAGADVVVGGHAHRLQGGGRFPGSGAVVHYGLGNFGFQANSAEGARTGVFLVTVTGRRVDGYQWVPGEIVDHQPVVLDGDDAADALAHWDSLRPCTGLDP